MPLSAYVAEFADQPLGPKGAIKGGRFAFNGISTGISCHNAAFMWIHQAAHAGAMPAIDDVVGCQAFVNTLLLHGHPSRVTEKSPPLTGDVLIFTGVEGSATEARHTCIAKAGGAKGVIGGYNQQAWFKGSSGLVGGRYSEFAVGAIQWAFRVFGPNQRANVGSAQFKIWAIREATAVNLMRQRSG